MKASDCSKERDAEHLRHKLTEGAVKRLAGIFHIRLSLSPSLAPSRQDRPGMADQKSESAVSGSRRRIFCHDLPLESRHSMTKTNKHQQQA